MNKKEKEKFEEWLEKNFAFDGWDKDGERSFLLITQKRLSESHLLKVYELDKKTKA